MKRIIITLFTAISLTATLLHSGTVVTAKDKLSEYDKNVQTIMNKCYMNTDNKLKDYIKNNNYHITFLKEDEKINDIYDNIVESSALIDYQERIIYIQYDTNTINLENSLHHELGHALDCQHGFISETSNFDSVWNLRNDFFKFFDIESSYYTNNRRECFAQMYSIFKQYPEWLMKTFPNIYKYYNNL